MNPPVSCLKFSYLGTTRFVICDLDAPYERVQELVAQTFMLPEECISAIQFTDGKGYIFNKNLFEYFIILFPEPEQKFYVRLECRKIIENHKAAKNGLSRPLGTIQAKDSSKRKRQLDQTEDDIDQRFTAVPVRRQNCFIGEWPANGTTIIDDPTVIKASPPFKRLRLMQSKKSFIKRSPKALRPKRTLRM